jgi:hypothetical protein
VAAVSDTNHPRFQGALLTLNRAFHRPVGAGLPGIAIRVWEHSSCKLTKLVDTIDDKLIYRLLRGRGLDHEDAGEYPGALPLIEMRPLCRVSHGFTVTPGEAHSPISTASSIDGRYRIFGPCLLASALAFCNPAPERVQKRIAAGLILW